MRLALIADEYTPARTSVAVQMRDLAIELLNQRHHPTVIVPSASLKSAWKIDHVDGVEVLRIRAPRTKDIGLVRRAISEYLLPHAMRFGVSKSALATTRWDGVIWYSPTIFFGPLVRWLKRRSGCRSYLILRDMFPDWAVDTGVMKKGPAYYLLKRVESGQYRAADVIGVQTPANMALLKKTAALRSVRLEVLYNWLTPYPDTGSHSISMLDKLAGKTVFVYAGNMGVAQGMDILLDLAKALRDHEHVVFLFIGRGTEVERLKSRAEREAMSKVYFHDEVDPHELPGLFAHCHVGMLTLDPRHTTHNIPGKFLAYIHAGLPVLARVNHGNDLIEIIESHSVGCVSAGSSGEEILRNAISLAEDPKMRTSMGASGRGLAKSLFYSERVAQQIVDGLRNE